MHFDWMLFDRVDKQGIWFISTTKKIRYVFYWNPFKLLKGWILGGIHIGLPPLYINHFKHYENQ